MNYRLLLLLVLEVPKFATAQTDSCSCSVNLQELIKKTEENYIAFHQKIKGHSEKEKQYNDLVSALKSKAAQSNTKDCIGLLKAYTTFFKDGHLFITESPDYTAEELQQFKSAIKEIPITEEEAKQYLSKKQPDSIEGIWYAQNQAYRFAVIQDAADKKKFNAIVLFSSNPAWKPGMVKARFTKEGNQYHAQYYTANFSLMNYEADVHKNSVMNIGALIYWGKLYPNASKDQQYVNKTDAMLPTVTKLDNDNMLISIPSFLIDYAYFDSLITSHKQEITSSKNLIVDIRGNGGGNGIYFPLLQYYYTRPYQDSQGLALSSPDNIRYFQRQSSFQKKAPGDTTLNIYEAVVRDMQNDPGKIVNGPRWPKNSGDVIYDNPRKVAILTDRFCASAAESFILHSKGFSDRVTTFGENTSGTIDYTSVNILPLQCKKQHYLFGYPTSTLNKSIPNKGYNETGIRPDVKISDAVGDKVQFVLNWLKKNE